jgi:hypothetical protein
MGLLLSQRFLVLLTDLKSARAFIYKIIVPLIQKRNRDYLQSFLVCSKLSLPQKGGGPYFTEKNDQWRCPSRVTQTSV